MSTNNYRLIPKHGKGDKVAKAIGIGVERSLQKTSKVAKTVSKNKKFADRLRTDPKFRDAYNNGSDEIKRVMRETGDYATPVRRTSTAVAKTDKTSKAIVKTGKTEQKATNVGKAATKTTEKATDAGKKAANVGKKAAQKTTNTPKQLPAVISPAGPTDLALIPRNIPNETKNLLRSKWGNRAMWLGAAALGAMLFGSGDSNNPEEVSTEGTNELGEDTPQLVNNFGHVDDTDLTPTPNPAQPQQDPTLQTNPRDVNTPASNTNTSTTTSGTQNTAGTQDVPQNTVVQTTVPVASPFPNGYVIDRRGVRHQLDRIADGAYGSNTYELVIGLENTPDSNPFKRALMNRLGMSVWNSNEAYNRLAQMGIRGYIGGRDRKRLRNLINSGTNINGEINGFKTGGKLKLVKRYV